MLRDYPRINLPPGGITRPLESFDATPYACPMCGGDLARMPSKLLDRLLRPGAPVHRFRCTNEECGCECYVRTRVRKHTFTF